MRASSPAAIPPARTRANSGLTPFRSRPPEAAARRDTLLPYFAARHAAHERLTLTNVKINGVSVGGYRNFEFRLTRNADDLPKGPLAYRGKGASTCSTGRLIAWVMGIAP